jgi:hypothetical protein
MSDIGGSKWSDIPAYITALATSLAAVFAWLSYRYLRTSSYPIVECDEPRWIRNPSGIALDVTIRNRSTTAHALFTARVLKPKHCPIKLSGNPTAAAPELDLSWLSVPPVGRMGYIPIASTPAQPADLLPLTFVLEPPSSFLSGKLRILLVISDKSIKPRHRRFVILKFIQATPAKINEAIINNND